MLPSPEQQQAERYFAEASATMLACQSQAHVIASAAQAMSSRLGFGGTAYWFGNGGSAADAQHLSTELMGRFKVERPPIRSIALTTDTSLLTAVANDWSFEDVFKRQVQGLVSSRDVVVGITTSGQSANVIAGLKAASEMGACTVVFLGGQESLLSRLADFAFCVPSVETSHIQECHIAAGQLMCALVESALAQPRT